MTGNASRPHLFCFGLGYSAGVLAAQLQARGWRVGGARRSPGGSGIVAFDGTQPLPADCFSGVTHLLSSVPPDDRGDPVLRTHADLIANLPGLRWIGYLSTTGVYGDHQGGWVDETTPVTPMSDRGRRRADAEQGWLALGAHVFRLPGIYGPGRSAIEDVRAGRARRIDKPGQVFSRIHVEDIARVLMASMARPNPGAVYNVCDDEAAPSQDVIAFACELLNVPPPPLVPFAEAGLSPMAASFYAESKRVRNDRIKTELGVELKYPTYREGLRAIAGQ